MAKNVDPIIFAGKVAARINEFCVARTLSMEQLAKAANLTAVEVRAIQEDHEKISIELLKRIARVFDVHPAVLLMCPTEDAIAQVLEPYRDLPKDDFQRIAGELVSRGYRRSGGSA